MSPPLGSPHLLIGQKGSGKSALLNFTLKVNEKLGIPTVKIKPSDITVDLNKIDSALGNITHVYKRIVLLAIATQILEKKSGLLLGADAELYEECVREGTKRADLITKVARSFSGIARVGDKIDLSAAFPALPSMTAARLSSAISMSLNEKKFVLLFDDTDQVANLTQVDHLNRIWAIILAVRAITEENPSVTAIVTLRTEVWNRLKRDEFGQRDQIDHFGNLCTMMNPTRELVTEILERRLDLAKRSSGCEEGKYACFFEGNGARAPHSTAFSNWRDLIVIRSRERPRDAIQLLNNLAKQAIDSEKEKIDEADFRAVMPTFSKGRAELIAQELQGECGQVLEILNSFAKLNFDENGFKAGAEQVLTHLSNLPGAFGIQIHGRTLTQGRRDHAFILWDFLFANGILNARVADNEKKDGYRHLVPSAEARLVSEKNWNEMQRVIWEIHPAYRDHLMEEHAKRQRQVGLPPVKPKRRKKRR